MKPNHGFIEELPADACADLLRSVKYGHLACHTNGDLNLVPLSFYYEDGYIYSHSRRGTKIRMMRSNPHVCVQAEKIQDFFHWKSVMAWGRFEELDGPMASVVMRQLIRQLSESSADRPASELELDFVSMFESAIVYRIKVDKMTGRSEGWTSTK